MPTTMTISPKQQQQKSTLATLLLASSLFINFCSAFVAVPSPRHSFLLRTSDSDDEPIFYNDFGDDDDFAGGHDSSFLPSALQDRISNLQQREIEKETTLLQNWQRGNWKVRGFSLDPEPAFENSDVRVAAQVSTLAVGDHSEGHLLWVGRTDGSIFAVQLGTEYWTKFRSSLTLQEDTNVLASQLVRDDDDEKDESQLLERPFEIACQIQSTGGGGPVNCMYVGGDDESRRYLYTSTLGSSTIQQWLINDDDDNDNKKDSSTIQAVATATLNGHASTNANILTLQAVSLNVVDKEPNILFSAADDGSLALWDIHTGDLLYRCSLPHRICSADAHGSVVFVGDETGHVSVYNVKEWVEAAAQSGAHHVCPLPKGSWLINEGSIPVTSIKVAGEGTLGRGQQKPTLLLLTGDDTGMVKQWEVLSRSTEEGGERYEQWPKMATQRLPKKAHVFPGHEGAITALQSIDSTKFLSAATDGTVVAWNPATGKEYFRMDGFTSKVSSLCIMDDVVVTDGMKSLVCVHDFDVEWDPEFELDFENE